MKKSKFPLFLTLYTVVFLAAIAFGLGFLWKYLEAYERSLPAGVISEYEKQYLHAEYDSALTKYGAEHSSDFESASAVVDWMAARLDESTLRVKRSKTGSELDYDIRVSGQVVGSLQLAVDGPEQFGLGVCRIENNTWEFPEGLTGTYQVTAPQDALVLVNGVLLTDQNSETAAVPMKNDLLTAEIEVPSLKRYSFSCFEKPEVTVQQSDKTLYRLEEVNDTTWSVTASCNAQDSEKYRSFAEEFIDLYVAYSAGKLYVHKLTPYLVEGSALSKLIMEASGTMVYVVTGNFQITDLEFKSFQPCGEAVICEASYKITDDLRHSDVDISLELLIVEREGEYKVLNLVMY